MLLGFVSNTRSNDPIWTTPPAGSPPSRCRASAASSSRRLSRSVRLARRSRSPSRSSAATRTPASRSRSRSPPSRPPRPARQPVPLLYGMSELVLIPAFALIAWKCGLTYAPATEPLCVALAGNYQPVEKAAPPPRRPAPGAARARGGGARGQRRVGEAVTGARVSCEECGAMRGCRTVRGDRGARVFGHACEPGSTLCAVREYGSRRRQFYYAERRAPSHLAAASGWKPASPPRSRRGARPA